MNVRALALVVVLASRGLFAFTQSSPDTGDAHVAAARTAAGKEDTALLERLCGALTGAPRTPPPQAQDRAAWHAEPVKVFDNLYFVGQTEYSAWAVATSAGIILVD